MHARYDVFSRGQLYDSKRAFPINWPIDFKLNEIIIKKIKDRMDIGGILQNC